ncbi:MdtA/MuxA family multidrug efflux RND transporter periplasmic adaptor subunit [Luteimonas sp. M1R5S18]|uniref:MdtA/MuxA family multidrug efflux RND transporter periplasmic adaptor subunit n=1 Tax=Luteimonas rhizosphaericola TaxID=3042024 RepID=A0ABT6JKL0_9GAMM|nr:MdtA/MuxA family multidrug efflux RND transporter periplasmic adaptor subunit [Luteimonas rhizosphaericola]MDH5831218.1 MdtA/MuxA family multidrug efflux RND transporter periplasmic adaptor subunit [Luteimonas rhizosphaericola]
MTSRRFVRPALIALAVLLAAVLVWRGMGGGAPEPDAGRGGWGPDGERPPTPVRVSTAARERLSVELKALGTVTPLKSVTVRPRVDGELQRVVFEEGQQVEAGALLAEIDPASFRIQLAQALGQQKQNLAELENARIQLRRYQDLSDAAYVSAQDVANLQAQVRQLEGRREIDQAAVDEARLQLQYTRIVAPITGRVGLRTVDAGNLVSGGDEDGIATIAQTRPISVLFSVPENALAAVIDAVRRDPDLTVQAWDREERNVLASGRLSSLDNRIDTETGTLRLRALFDNDDGALFPNQFVNARLQLGDDETLVIPDAAVQFGSEGTYVYVVNDDDTAGVRPVVLGAGSGGRVSVLDGLEAGARVVLEGIDRLREGAPVEVVADAGEEDGDAGAPAQDADPDA